jgi:exodeoxyribonuclease VII small subunit
VTDTPPQKLTYEQAVEELKSITDELNDGLVDVDALTDRFQRAIDIMEDLDARIRRARAKVDELAPRLEALSRPTGEAPPAPAGGGDAPAPAYDYGDEPF